MKRFGSHVVLLLSKWLKLCYLSEFISNHPLENKCIPPRWGGWSRMSFQTSHFVYTIHHLESTLLMEDMGCTKLCRLWNSLKVKMSLKLYVEHNFWPKSCIASAPSQFHLEYNERRRFLLETHHSWGSKSSFAGGVVRTLLVCHLF